MTPAATPIGAKALAIPPYVAAGFRVLAPHYKPPRGAAFSTLREALC